MHDLILFSILGLGVGTAYALTATGVVLIYKGSGVVNFAQGGIAMLAAFSYMAGCNAGMSKWVVAPLCVAGAGVGGFLIYMVLMRRLRDYPVLAKVVATIGLLVTMQGAALLFWGRGSSVLTPPSLLPTDPLRLFGVAFGADRLYLLGIAIAVAVALSLLFRHTRVGLATRAAAENERGAALIGFSPTVIGAGNWAAGAALAGLAGVLLAPIAVLDIAALSLIILPAVAAALAGRFSSFAPTVAAGLLIGVGQSLLTRYWSVQGIGEAIPLVIVLGAMIVTGSLIPARGAVTLGRPPFSPPALLRPFWFVAVGAVILAVLVLLSRSYQAAIATSMITAILALSVVVITGYVGQTSLAPMTFAGIGGFIVSKLAHDVGVPFPWAMFLAAFAAVPLGVLIGLPALRARGINLAVVTLAVAGATDFMVFQNLDLTGGAAGSPVPPPAIAGLSLDATLHPVRFGIFAMVVLGAIVIMVCNLRQSGSGRRMLAVRANERAAAAAGISVTSTKLYAFAISAWIAAFGGAMLAYQLNNVSYGRFTALQSLLLVATVYIGGIASVSGALVAGWIGAGGVPFVLLVSISGIEDYWALLTGAGVLLTILAQPDGIGPWHVRMVHALRGRRARPADAAIAAAAKPAS